MINLHIHQTQHTIADFDGIFSYLKSSYSEKQLSSLHIFPELFLTGYPLQDLCLQDSFIQTYLAFLSRINSWSQSLSSSAQCFLIGGLSYENYDPECQDYKIKNVIYRLIPGKKLEVVYTKQLLPNYDIFDERKYFGTGKEPSSIEFQGQHIGLLICEDMWPSTFYENDPSQKLHEHFKAKNIAPSLLVNLSASPFALGKKESRLKRSYALSEQFQCPYAYVNRVGAEDEIIFDGNSFIVDAQDKNYEQQAKLFSQDILTSPIKSLTEDKQLTNDYSSEPEHVWQNLFKAQLQTDKKQASLYSLSSDSLKTVLSALKFSMQEYASKNGFKKFTVALSGGMDSALVLTIARLSLKQGQELEAIYMPSQYSATLSYELSQKLCQNLGVKLTTVPIKFLHSATRNLFQQTFKEPLQGVSDENIQSRLRGSLLYARSNQTGSMVLNTSNKSEIAVGYSTQYGDSVGALSILGDLYKSEIYQLAEYINLKSPGLIPEGIITRAPSAELRDDQEDSQSLPPYEVLDAILEAILSYQYSKKEILELGFQEKDVDRVFKLYRNSEFKRFQFCPITKIKMKSFGFGYRLPISKNGYIYTTT